jgi:hypothetical protein
MSTMPSCDVLLRKRVCLAPEAPPVSLEETIFKQLADKGWAADDIRVTIWHMKQRGSISLQECQNYLEKMFGTKPKQSGAQAGTSVFGPAPPRSTGPALPGSPARADFNAVKSYLLQIGIQQSRIESCFAAVGTHDVNMCLDWIATNFKDASPTDKNESSAVSSRSFQQEHVLSVLLCVGATTALKHEDFFKNAHPTRQQFDSEVEIRLQHGDPVNALYKCHARWGLQAALHLCHPSFAADDDVMVIAARKSIEDEVLTPLQKVGWDGVVPAFRALWAGARDVALPESVRDLIEAAALTEHDPACRSLSSLPTAFPFAYAETLAIHMACAESSQAIKPETKQVMERIRTNTGATFARLLRFIEAPQSDRGDDPLQLQLNEVVEKAKILSKLSAYSSETRHLKTIQDRRRNRCLCLCSAHLFNESKKLFHDGEIVSKFDNPLQPDIDKLICVALSARPSIGRFLSLMFENSPYRVPSNPEFQQDPELNVFRNDFMSLIGFEHVRPHFVHWGHHLCPHSRAGTWHAGGVLQRSSRVAFRRCFRLNSAYSGHAVGCIEP